MVGGVWCRYIVGDLWPGGVWCGYVAGDLWPDGMWQEVNGQEKCGTEKASCG